MSGKTDGLGSSIEGLQVARQKLAAIEGKKWEELEIDGQKAHAHALQKVNMVLKRLEAAKPEGLSSEFKKQEPALQAAVTKLKADLKGVDDPAKVVRVVSGVIDSIAKIAALVSEPAEKGTSGSPDLLHDVKGGCT
jgi:hypothetical protein